MTATRAIFALAFAALLGACATGERLSAAGDVHALLVSIRNDDRTAFDAHVDRKALEAELQARLVDRARSADAPQSLRAVGLLASGPLARLAGEALIRPDVFRAVADYYGYGPDKPIPGVLALAQVLRPAGEGRVCAAKARRGPCLLTFADEAGTWRLVGFEGDPAMLGRGAG
jgi:hypothetical protein